MTILSKSAPLLSVVIGLLEGATMKHQERPEESSQKTLVTPETASEGYLMRSELDTLGRRVENIDTWAKEGGIHVLGLISAAESESVIRIKIGW